jgi:hypothetical protein
MTDSSDDRVVRVLEEMRDAQREQLALSRQAIENQTEAIRVQRDLQGAARGRLKLIAGLIVFVLLMIVVVLGMLMRRVS